MGQKKFWTIFFILSSQIFAYRSKTIADENMTVNVNTKDVLQKIGVKEHLGNSLPLEDLFFIDEQGNTVAFKKYFGTKPILLQMIYYRCPHLCNFMMNGLLAGLKDLEFTVGKEFDILTVSINPQEDFLLSQQKKKNILKEYARSSDGWYFFTGTQMMIEKLAQAIGFQYEQVEGEYAHSAVIFLITPQGMISRYLYGVEFTANTLRLGIVEAAEGKIGNVIDRILLYCFHYDPITKKYSVKIYRVMQSACLITVLLLVGLIGLLWKKTKKELMY